MTSREKKIACLVIGIIFIGMLIGAGGLFLWKSGFGWNSRQEQKGGSYTESNWQGSSGSKVHMSHGTLIAPEHTSIGLALMLVVNHIFISS